MMEPGQTPAGPPVARALVEALALARWEVSELMSRHPGVAAQRLDARAADLARSPVAADQILSLALSAGAEDLRRGRAPLEEGALFFFAHEAPDEQARREVRRAVFGPDSDVGRPEAGGREIVRDLEARRRAHGFADGALSQRLAEDAALHEGLWDDPRLPADPEARRRMAASAPAILERARDLDPSRRRERRRRRARRPERRAAPASPAVEALRRPPILLSVEDHERLKSLAFDALLAHPRAAAPLLREVERAAVVPDHAVPPDVVRLGSWVGYSEAFAGLSGRGRLVCPRQAGKPGALSVLSSIGSAVVGLAVGQSILWQDHTGLEQLVTVTEVAER